MFGGLGTCVHWVSRRAAPEATTSCDGKPCIDNHPSVVLVRHNTSTDLKWEKDAECTIEGVHRCKVKPQVLTFLTYTRPKQKICNLLLSPTPPA